MDEKLIRNSDFWKSVGNVFPSPIVIIKKNGDIVYENDAFKRCAVLSHASLFHSLDSEYETQLKKIISQCESEKKMLCDRLRVKVLDEKVLYFTYYMTSLEDGLFSLLLTDTTEKNNDLMMLNNIVNTAPDPIFVKDERHQYLYVNQAFADSLGHPISYVVGKSDVDFFPETESEVFYTLDRKTFKSGKTTINEEKFTSTSGIRDISTKKSVFKTLNGNKILVGIIRDVTELNAARECLEKHAKELERQVDASTKQLDLLKSVATLQNQYVHQAFEDFNSMLRDMVQASQTPEQLEKQASRLKESMTKAMDHTSNVANIIVKTDSDFYKKA